MRRAPALLLILLLLGGNVAIVQGVAWASMLAERTARMGWDRAVDSTFSGREPCPLCQAAQALRSRPAPDAPAPELNLLKFQQALPMETVGLDLGHGPGIRIRLPEVQAMPEGIPPSPRPPPPKAA